MTLQIQAGAVVDAVIQSALTQLQKKYNVHQISLYQGEQVVLTVGEPVWHGELPKTWQAQKIQGECGETWLLPIMVRRLGWGWFVSHWRGNVNSEIEPEWELFTAHLGLIIQANGGWNYHNANYAFPESYLPTTDDEPYHFLLNALPIGVALTDVEGNCIYGNEYLMQHLFQMSAQEILGWNWANAIHPEDRERVTQSWQRAVQTPPHEYREEYRLQRRDGSVVWVEDYALPNRRHDGEVMGFICVAMDITQAKELQDTLTKSEQKYRRIVDYQTDFLLYSSSDKAVTFANPCLYDALGYSMKVEEMLGLPWEQIVLHSQDLQILEQKINQLTPEHPIFQNTNPIQGKHGQILYVDWINLGIFDETGRLSSIQSIGRDVTALLQAEQELQESRQRFATLLENMPGMVYRYHPQTSEHPHRFSYVSDYAEEIFELPVAEIMADATAIWMNFTHPEDWNLLLTSIQEAFANSSPWFCQWRIITPSGKLKWVEGRSQMRQSHSEPFWDGIVIDITEIKTAQLELARQKEFLHRIVTATKAIIYIYDLEENRNVFANPEIESVLGYSVAEIQAMGSRLLPNLIHPEDWPQIEVSLTNLFEPNFARELQIEYRMRTKSGEWRWLFSWDRIFKRNAQGFPQQILGVATDITALKEVESALAESQKLLESLLTNLPVTIWRYQLWPDGREALLYVSPGCEDLWGVTPEQAMQNTQTLRNLVVPEDLSLIDILGEESRQNLTPYRGEFRIATPEGERKWLQIHAQPERQPDGSIVWDAVLLDITARKQAQIALERLNQELEQRIRDRTFMLEQQAQEEGLLRIIIETIHESLDINQTLHIVLDETRATLTCDRVVIYQFNEDWTGYFLAESVGAGWVPVVTGSLTSLSDHCLQETQGGRFQQRYILISNDIYKSGFTDCHIQILERFQARAQVVIPIFLEQKLWGLLAAYQNDNPRIWQTSEIEILQHVGLHLAIALRQAELYKASQSQVVELQKLNKLKDEFLSTVSHELRSPMHNIGMAIKMLELRLQRAGVLDNPELGIERYLDILKSATQREVELINDLLDLARLNAEQLDLELESVDVEQVLDHLLPPIQERTQSQKQNFILQRPEHFCPLYSHAHSLERILQELLHNACKYTPAGETITLAIECELGNHCNFRVINTGVEIPIEEQERVFDNFYRIPNHDPWQHGGTGLGLALVKKLVERLQGQIHLTSGNNATEFWVSLPIGSALTVTPSPSPDMGIRTASLHERES